MKRKDHSPTYNSSTFKSLIKGFHWINESKKLNQKKPCWWPMPGACSGGHRMDFYEVCPVLLLNMAGVEVVLSLAPASLWWEEHVACAEAGALPQALLHLRLPAPVRVTCTLRFPFFNAASQMRFPENEDSEQKNWGLREWLRRPCWGPRAGSSPAPLREEKWVQFSLGSWMAKGEIVQNKALYPVSPLNGPFDMIHLSGHWV